MSNIYQLKNIGFRYDSGFSLSGINVDIVKSSITAIVGPNGSGKTSLLNLLSFMALPDSGSILCDGEMINQNNRKRFIKKVGYIQQSPYLLRGTAFKNIELGLKLQHVDKNTRSIKVLEIMKLLGISALSDRDARSLSGGEAQKVAIGQVLALEPEVLILDEPFTHLDKSAIHDLEQLIISLKNELNKTVIFTTHNQIQAQWLSDNVYSVIEGKLFETDLINLFSGILEKEANIFNTGKISIAIPDGVNQAEHIAIDPKQIVISKQQINSSMQNSFSGKITGMKEEGGQIKLSMNAGENIQAIITHKALAELELSIGSDVWISFKSSSILIF
jgi:tungstate transport system ATP-binding protein